MGFLFYHQHTKREKMRLLLVLGMIFLAPRFLSANPLQSPVEETLVPLGHSISGEDIYVNSLVISPNLNHIGYVSRIGSTFRVWLDGVSEKSHSRIKFPSPFFSPQGTRLAYIAYDNDKMFVVVDGKEHARYKNAGAVTFSPDGSRIAYRAEDDKDRHMVVVDGDPGPAFDVRISHEVGVVFSPDSRQVAYAGINQNNSWIFVKDHKKMRSFKKIGQVKFSPDSSHVAYTAMEKDNWVVVLDDKKGAGYNLVNNLIFSPDGSQLAYMAQKNRRRIIVKDNKEISGGMGTFAPAFSPDGSRFAFLLAEKDNQFRYIIDGKQELPVKSPGRLIFSHDGTSTAYAALINDKWHIIKDGVKGPAFKKIYAFSFSPFNNDIMYAADNDDGKTCVVFNTAPEKFYDAIGVPVFAPDEKKYGYVARKNEKEMFMVIMGEEKTPYPIIGIPIEDESGKPGFDGQLPFFSPRGNRLAYPVYDLDKEKAFMVVDGKVQPSFDAVLQPIFSNDEKHVAYMAKKDDGWRLVVDGQAGSHTCDGLIKGASIAFDPKRRCFFVLVARETESGLAFFRLEAKIKDPS